MNDLKIYLQKNFYLSNDGADRMASIMVPINKAKGEVFVKKDHDSPKEYILFSGICRSYLHNANDDEVTLSFFTKHTAISPNVTRTVRGRSILNIQALSDINMGEFDTEDLMSMMRDHREIEIWGNTILQKELMNKVTKEINQISLTAKERLLDFRERYEGLENLIPHSYIASYLGITNVSLSRIRKELTK